MIEGVRLALTVLTVLPVRAGRFDRATAAVAMAVAPVVGLLLGLILAGVLAGLRLAGVPGLVAGGVTVAAGALLTRGLHLDGLADTADALGSYRRGDAALEIMKKSDIGPFGVAAIALTVLIQTAAVSTLPVWSVTLAWAIGRLGVVVACNPRFPAARPEGLGALVAGSVPTWVAMAVSAALAAAATFVTGPWLGGPASGHLGLGALTAGHLGLGAFTGPLWLGPAAVAAALLVVVPLVAHCVRRFGGITGDVIGAAVETATTVALVTLTAG